VKGRFDVSNRTVDIHQHAVGVDARNRQTVRARKLEDLLHVLSRGSETRRKLSGGEVLMVQRTVGIIDLSKKIGKPVVVFKWQADSKVESG
jgi:hypothetical protein